MYAPVGKYAPQSPGGVRKLSAPGFASGRGEGVVALAAKSAYRFEDGMSLPQKLIAAALLCGGVALLVVLILDEEYLEMRWALWGIFVLCLLVEGRWLQWKVMKRKLLDAPSNRGAEAQRKHRLYVERTMHHIEQRIVMIDIVDTVLERIRHYFHSLPLKLWLEARMDTIRFDKAGDTIGALESKLNWNVDWPPVGRRKDNVVIDFGHVMRQVYFPGAPAAYLDVASWGLVPEPVLVARRQWDDANQKNPVLNRFKTVPMRMNQARAQVATVVGSDPDDIVIVPHAADAVSAILRGLPWEIGDKLMIITTKHGDSSENTESMNRNADAERTFYHAGEFLLEHSAVDVVLCELPIPCSDRDIFNAVTKSLKAHVAKPKVACFAHVMPHGWLLPAEKLTLLLHKYGVSVLIDGSLAMGQQDVDVSQISADWYAADLFRFVPGLPGCGFLVATPLKHPCSFPLTVSYFDQDGFVEEFSYYGLRDFSNQFSIIDTFDFVEKVCGGWHNMRKYCTEIAYRGEKIIANKWSGAAPIQGRRLGENDVVVLAPGRKKDSCMRFHGEQAVIVADAFDTRPYQVQGERGVKNWYTRSHVMSPNAPFVPNSYGAMPTFRLPGTKSLTSLDAARVEQALQKRGVSVHVFAGIFQFTQSYLFVRVSVGIHTTVEDFDALADAVLAMQSRYGHGALA
ncbi:putative L-cysteine desulfhydrase 1 [Diplonema papillatum]|nr:putative L-cysteine desulfhydrase 1 [Diplonema papillatum]